MLTAGENFENMNLVYSYPHSYLDLTIFYLQLTKSTQYDKIDNFVLN